MQTTLQLMKQFNVLLDREHKAAIFLDNNDIPLPQREKWIPEYRKILNELNGIFLTLKMHGYEMSQEETSHGFRQVKFLDL